jgi:predicted transcriptional regulator
MSSAPANPDLLALAAQIVSAHVAHNAVPMDTLPRVIESVYATLSGLESPPPPVEAPPPAARRAYRRRAAVTPETPDAPAPTAPTARRGKRRAG